MSVQLLVRWPNSGHQLLSNATVELSVDGADVAPASSQPGRYLFEIQAGSSHAQLKVRFNPVLQVLVFNPVLNVDEPKEEAFEVLKADQAYIIEGTSLKPDPSPVSLVNGEVVMQNINPLIDSVSAANASAGVTVAEVRTEYVDATQFWKRNVHFYQLATFQYDTERENSFVAIASTGGAPPLWFAHFPIGLEPPTPEVGTITFLRPALAYQYTTAWDRRHKDINAQFGLNRYLLAPRDPDQPFPEGELIPRPAHSYTYFSDWNGDWTALRVGMQQAVIRSGKAVVVLHPWPTSGLDFGDAETSRLPVVMRGILRLLRGLGYLGANHARIVPGRMGIACYSRGGLKFRSAFLANRHLIREVYLFDPLGLAEVAPHLIQWAANTPDFRLRMSGADRWAQMAGIRRSVQSLVSGEAGDLQVSVHPEHPVFWDTAQKGGSPYWDFVLQKKPHLRNDAGARHQFAMFGGNSITVDAGGRMTDNLTYFEHFLRTSGY